MALFSIKNSCFATIGCLVVAFATAACSSGSDSNDQGAGDGHGWLGRRREHPRPAARRAAQAEPAARRHQRSASTPSRTDTEVYLRQPGNATAVNDLTSTSTFSWDSLDGAPDKVADVGSMRIETPFSAYTQPDQAVDFQFMLDGRPVDLTGKTLFIYLKLDSGFSPDPSSPGGLMFYAKSNETNWDWGQAPWQNIDSARPHLAEVHCSTSPTPSQERPTSRRSIRARSCRSASSSTREARPRRLLPAPPAPATFHLDTIGYQ